MAGRVTREGSISAPTPAAPQRAARRRVWRRRIARYAHRATCRMACGAPVRALGAVWIALFSLGFAAPVEAGRPFNDIEESAVQVALEYWGTAPSCPGGFERFSVTDAEMDSSSFGRGHNFGGYADWAPGSARDCKVLLAERTKREGYATFCTFVTHEIGHLIRLDGWHSHDPTDVMYAAPRSPTPHCRAREQWMLAESDRLGDHADGLRRRCRGLRRAARIARYRRCDRRVKVAMARSSALMSAVDEVR